jgi:GDP-D-mannose dehydratase
MRTGGQQVSGEVTALGATRLLEAIRAVDREVKFYQASSPRPTRTTSR